MKKRIFIFLTLLIACFGLFSVISNNKVTYAAGNDITDHEADVIENSVPDRAILSFPVTYISAYGNDISWDVEKDQSVITYDEEAKWMVVDRSQVVGESQTINIILKVADKSDSNVYTEREIQVIVPSGKTLTRSFSITYKEEDGQTDFEFTEEEIDSYLTSYNLGDKTYVLPTPSKEGYNFEGWYEGETKVEKILVGSMKDYNLVARWSKIIYPITEDMISFKEDYDYTYSGTGKNPFVVKDGDKELVLDEDYTITFDDNINAGEVVATIAGKGDYNGSIEKTFEIYKATLTLTLENQSKSSYVGLSAPKWSLDDFNVIGYVNNEEDKIQGELSHTYKLEDETKDESFVGSNAGTYNVEFSGLTAANYEIVFDTDATVVMSVADVVLYAVESFTYDGTEHTLTAKAKDAEGNEINDGEFTYDEDRTQTNAGIYDVTVEFTHDDYGTVTQIVQLVIAKRDITITANDIISVYGETPEANGYEVTEGSIMGTDDLQIVVSVESNKVNNTTIPSTIADAVVVSYDTNNINYNVSIEKGSCEVVKRTIKVIADSDKTSAYKDTLAELTYTFADEDETYYSVLDADLAEVKSLISLNFETNPTVVGSYNIIVTALASNKYQIDVQNGIYTVTAKDISSIGEIVIDGTDWNMYEETNKPNVSLQATINEVLEVISSELYEVTYVNADAPGTATVTVTLNEGGNYTGTVSKTYLITEKGVAFVDAEIIRTEYDSIFANNLNSNSEIQVPLTGINGSTIVWISDYDGFTVDAEGNVTITEPETEITAKLRAYVTYADSSADFVEFTVVFDAKSNEEPEPEVPSGQTSVSQNNVTVSNLPVNANVQSVEVTSETLEGYDYAFDITLKDGEGDIVTIGEETFVNVTIPGTFVIGKEYDVYYINGQNQQFVATVEATSESSLTFSTNHFSVYAVKEHEEEVVYESLFDLEKEYVIYAYMDTVKNYYYLTNTLVSNKLSSYNNGLVSEIINPSDDLIWVIEFDENSGYYYIKNKSNNTYFGSNGNNNQAKLSFENEKEPLIITKVEGKTYYKIQSTLESTRYLELNENNKEYFAFYAGTQMGDLYIEEAIHKTDSELQLEVYNHLPNEMTITSSEELITSSIYDSSLTWDIVDGDAIYYENDNLIVVRPDSGKDDALVIMNVSIFVGEATPITKQINVYVKALPIPVQLDTPELTVDGNVVKWCAVSNASVYEVYINKNLVETTSLISFSLSEYTAGKYTVAVKAIPVPNSDEYLASEMGTTTVTISDEVVTPSIQTATLSFADKAQRTSFTTSQQIWEQNGIKLTNNKSKSTNNVADYAAPARLYAGSEVIVECTGMTQIVFDCNSSSYATTLVNSIGTVEGVTVSASSDKVTVVFTETVDSFTIASLTAQVRIDSLTVTYLG